MPGDRARQAYLRRPLGNMGVLDAITPGLLLPLALVLTLLALPPEGGKHNQRE